MNLKKIIFEKISMFKDNPKILLHWGYKIGNIFKENTLNHGERYDPNILKKFNIHDAHQEARYYLAQTLISASDTVLDVACGTGYGTLLLAEKCSHATGFDISKVAIKYAQKNYKLDSKVDFIQSDIFNINMHADVVVSFETIEHIQGDIRKTILKLLSLADKKLICSVPYQEPIGVNRYHVHSNIDESVFDFPENLYQTQFFYQSKDGVLNNVKSDDNTYSLIIIIDKLSE